MEDSFDNLSMSRTNGGSNSPSDIRFVYDKVNFETKQHNRKLAPATEVNTETIKRSVGHNGYPMEVSCGMRRYGPAPNWCAPPPGKGCELFCGQIPPDIMEDTLIPKFELCGPLYDFRLFMNQATKKNLGHAFITYLYAEDADKAVHQLNGYEIRSGIYLSVNICREKVRLYVGNIPKIKTREELFEEFDRRVGLGLVDVIAYNSPEDGNNNRGFCFLEYTTPQNAIGAKKLLMSTGNKYWGCDVVVDWADPIHDPDPEIMANVRILYVRNLTQHITESLLWDLFSICGKLERVKRIKDFAFVHFEKRDSAEVALIKYDGFTVRDTYLQVQWSKPPIDKRKREEILRAREQRMIIALTSEDTSESYMQFIQLKNNPLKAPAGTLLTNPNPYCNVPIMKGHGDLTHELEARNIGYANTGSLRATRSTSEGLAQVLRFPVVHRYHNPDGSKRQPGRHAPTNSDTPNPIPSVHIDHRNEVVYMDHPYPPPLIRVDNPDQSRGVRVDHRYRPPEIKFSKRYQSSLGPLSNRNRSQMEHSDYPNQSKGVGVQNEFHRLIPMTSTYHSQQRASQSFHCQRSTPGNLLSPASMFNLFDLDLCLDADTDDDWRNNRGRAVVPVLPDLQEGKATRIETPPSEREILDSLEFSGQTRVSDPAASCDDLLKKTE